MLPIMRVLYIGSFFPIERTEEITSNSKGYIDNAANNFQWALINGLDCYYPRVELITLPVIGSYPFHYKKAYFSKSFFSHKEKSNGKSMGFLNLPLIKHVSKYYNLYQTLKKIDSNEPTTIIIYAMHSPFLKAVFKLKANGYNLKTCLVIPDLPQFMSASKNIFYVFFKWIDSHNIKKYLGAIDSFVFFSDQMVDFIAVENKPWTRIEGIFLPTKNVHAVSKEGRKVILYTGSLAEIYGIKNLMNAFMLIQDVSYELWICGDGDYKGEIIKKSLIDKRIKYFGQLPFDEIQKMQKRATVLVNPRTSQGDYTKYSFPSKTMEYLASGTPCIMHRLPAIPPEYFPFLFIAEKEDAEGLKDKIIEVCNKEEKYLIDFGTKASEFILTNKNPESQVKKIFDMINNL